MIQGIRSVYRGLLVLVLVFVAGPGASPTASANGFMDKLNSVLKELPKPPAKSSNGAPATHQANSAAATSHTSGSSLRPVPNMGTREGTAALVKSTPDLSAGEFRLGMPADDAIASLKSLGYLKGRENNPVFGVFSFRLGQVPNQVFVGGAAGQLGNNTKNTRTSVKLNFTMYPNTPVVSSISRGISYPKSKAPTVGPTVAALRKKYGPESIDHLHMNTLIWLYDYQGHPLSKAAVNQLRKDECPQTTANTAMITIGDSERVSDRVTQGISRQRPACFDVISVTAVLGVEDIRTGADSADRGWDSVSQALMTRLGVRLTDMPLEQSASVATRNVALHNDQIRKQKELDAAKQRKAPSL